MNFKFQITLNETSKADAESKMGSLTELAKRLKSNELAKLAHIVKNDPVKTSLAKQYLEL